MNNVYERMVRNRDLVSDSVVASGTVYPLTATNALVDFGTTDPTLTLTRAGRYLILSTVKVDYNGATFASVRTVTLNLRRTNNGAANLTGGTLAGSTQIITALTFTMGEFTLASLYDSVAENDVISLFGDVSVLPSVGTINVTAASIIAIKIG